MRICKGQILGVKDEDFKMFESNTSNKCGCTLGSCKMLQRQLNYICSNNAPNKV